MVLATSELENKLSMFPLTGAGNFYNLDFQAMGTTCKIIFKIQNPSSAHEFKIKVLKWLTNFEFSYSRYFEHSLISTINQNAGVRWVEINEELKGIFSLCDWFNNTTNGLFDPSCLPLLKLWDFKKNINELPSKKHIDKALKLCGWHKVIRDGNKVFLPCKGMGIDIGGIGKEYAIDKVIQMAKDYGIGNIMVDFGHDIRVIGSPPEGGPWRVGIDDPFEADNCITGAALSNMAVATSGNYQRHLIIKGKRYGHILDVRTGYPCETECELVSVIAPTCTTAGIFSTTAFILGKKDGLSFIEQNFNTEGVILTHNKIYKSKRFKTYEI